MRLLARAPATLPIFPQPLDSVERNADCNRGEANNGAIFLHSIVLALTASVFASGQTTVSKVDRGHRDERELIELDREWWESAVRRDAVVLDRLLADDYVFTDYYGATRTKAEEIADATAPASSLSLESFRTEEVEVRISGGMATVTGRAVLKARFDEQDFAQRYWYTRTFARREGRWLMTAARMISLSVDDRQQASHTQRSSNSS